MRLSFKEATPALSFLALYRKSHYTSLDDMIKHISSDLERIVTGEGILRETIKRDTPVIEVVEILSYYIVSPTYKDFENLMNVELKND